MSNSSCPFCPENGKVDIIAEEEVAYLVEAKASPIEGCFLIIPKDHVTELSELPADWQSSFGSLVKSVPWHTSDSAFNVSVNCGRAAGQTLEHIHFWVIPRNEDASSGSYALGLATLIEKVMSQAMAHA